MKRYFKPVAECYNVKSDNLMGEASIGLNSETSADPYYDGGGDAKRGRSVGFDDFDDYDAEE